MYSEIELIKKAMSGDSNSQYRLAKAYIEQSKSDDDLAKARRWYSAASEHGHKRAKYELARLMMADEEIDWNAVTSLLKDASVEENDAAIELSKLYSDGVDLDYKTVIKCLREGSDRGSNRCKMRLAELLYKGESREERLESIKLCYELAMDGEKDAMFRLYLHYRYAVGTKTDMNIAVYWLKKAVESGHMGAKRELDSLSEGTP